MLDITPEDCARIARRAYDNTGVVIPHPPIVRDVICAAHELGILDRELFAEFSRKEEQAEAEIAGGSLVKFIDGLR